jgi:hypothetical protein
MWKRRWTRISRTLVGTGGELLCEGIEDPIVKVKITGPAANVMTVRVAITQKREIP